jgi:hypothetical protein
MAGGEEGAALINMDKSYPDNRASEKGFLFL